MGSKEYNRCKKCLRTGCPYKEEGMKHPRLKFYCKFFSKDEILEYPKEKIPDNDWEAKIEERNEMNKQYE